MNKFEMVDGPEDGIVLLRLWRDRGTVFGEVTGPTRSLGPQHIGGEVTAPIPGGEAVGTAVSLANRLGVLVGVSAQEGTWAAEWGELVPNGQLPLRA